jgi:hypothetical protein
LPAVITMTFKHSVALATIAVGTMASLTAARAIGQAPPTPDQMVAALKKNLADSQQRLRQYEWIETTAISLKGEEKSRKQQRVYSGADGKLVKQPIGQPPPQPAAQGGGGRGGRLKKKVVENKKEEMQEYMERAAKLIHMYVPPSPEQIQKAKDAGNMQVRPQPQGSVRVEFPNFVQPSDLMAIDVDAKAALLSALSVATYLEKQEDTVTLNVRFGTLADGTSYTAQTTLDAKAKNIRVVVENAGHRPLAR